MNFGQIKHIVRKKLRTTGAFAMRPLLLRWRSQNLKNYLRDCKSQGRLAGLHVGANMELLPGWFNCDIDTITRKLNYLDASKPLPFKDGTFDFVFSEHFFEHLTYEQGGVFLKEAWRVLKKGGVIRTAIPDFEFAVDLYALKSPLHRQYLEWYTKSFFPQRPVSPLVVVNSLFYGFGHRFIYDRKLLEHRLKEVGFNSLRVCKPGQSDISDLCGVEQHGKVVPPEFNALETTIVEAFK